MYLPPLNRFSRANRATLDNNAEFQVDVDDKREHGSGRTSGPLLSGTAYCISSCSMILLNKVVLSSYAFNAGISLMFYQVPLLIHVLSSSWKGKNMQLCSCSHVHVYVVYFLKYCLQVLVFPKQLLKNLHLMCTSLSTINIRFLPILFAESYQLCTRCYFEIVWSSFSGEAQLEADQVVAPCQCHICGHACIRHV